MQTDVNELLAAASPQPALAALVHQALVARVQLLLGQADFDALMATQEQVSQALARQAPAQHGASPAQGTPALAQAVLDALELDPGYYAGSELDFIVSEGLTSAGLALAEAVRGHERDSRARWQAEVVPTLDRIAAFVVAVFDGRWQQLPGRPTLRQCLLGGAG